MGVLNNFLCYFFAIHSDFIVEFPFRLYCIKRNQNGSWTIQLFLYFQIHNYWLVNPIFHIVLKINILKNIYHLISSFTNVFSLHPDFLAFVFAG